MKGRDEEEAGFRVARSAIAAELGTVQIVPEPPGIDAPWQIDGPGGFQAAGQGEAELTDRVPSSYTVTWGEVSGWVEPESETKALEPGGVVAFVGVYTQAPPPMGFVYVPLGTYQMGSPADEPGRGADETRHAVTLTKGLFVSQYMVTEEWWYEVMGGTPTTS